MLPVEHIEEEEVEIEPLPAKENKRRAVLEAVIEKNFRAFVETGLALKEIRVSKLYRSTHSTFAGYCADLWEMNDRRARQFMSSAEVIKALENRNNCSENGKDDAQNWSKIYKGVLPANEAQARPLTRIEPDHQPAVWAQVVMVASDRPGGKITAGLVERCVREFIGHTVERKKGETMRRMARDEKMSQDMKKFFKDLFMLVDEAKHEKWKSTTPEAILKYIDALRDIVVREA